MRHHTRSQAAQKLIAAFFDDPHRVRERKATGVSPAANQSPTAPAACYAIPIEKAGFNKRTLCLWRALGIRTLEEAFYAAPQLWPAFLQQTGGDAQSRKDWAIYCDAVDNPVNEVFARFGLDRYQPYSLELAKGSRLLAHSRIDFKKLGQDSPAFRQLETRTLNILRDHSIHTIGVLAMHSEAELASIPNLGRAMLPFLKDYLAHYGLFPGMSIAQIQQYEANPAKNFRADFAPLVAAVESAAPAKPSLGPLLPAAAPPSFYQLLSKRTIVGGQLLSAGCIYSFTDKKTTRSFAAAARAAWLAGCKVAPDRTQQENIKLLAPQEIGQHCYYPVYIADAALSVLARNSDLTLPSVQMAAQRGR